MSIKPISDNLQRAADWVGRKMSSPQQRALQGVVGVVIQPLIEYKNKDVDDDTRAVATSRMIAKVFSGALVGIIVRAGCIALMAKFAPTPKSLSELVEKGAVKGRSLLAPSIDAVKKIIAEQGKNLPDIYSDYRNGMGTLIGTLVGMYTNFSVDVPIAEWMTGKLIPVLQKKIDNDNKKADLNTSVQENTVIPGKSAITPIDNYLIETDSAPLSAKGGANG